mgnify:FL=1
MGSIIVLVKQKQVHAHETNRGNLKLAKSNSKLEEQVLNNPKLVTNKEF